MSARNNPGVSSASPLPAPTPAANTVVRFWACFILCLAVLGVISGLMLAGFFLVMGYHVF